jgi:magnesium-protoporphyrin O-methyltransferase
VGGCCDPDRYDDFFSERFARRVAKRYRRRGLDRTATRLVDFLAPDGSADLTDATVLEIGGGVGEIGIELLRRGAASVTEVELATVYDEEAARLAEAAGVGDRMERRIVDVAAAPDEVETADLVVLHRVVCCYPDHERLLGAAADLCRGRLAFSHPPRNAGTRVLLALQNGACAAMRKDYRAFVHPPEAMRGVLRDHGLDPVMRHAGMVWHAEGAVRAA